jgi:hypothetical protein
MVVAAAVITALIASAMGLMVGLQLSPWIAVPVVAMGYGVLLARLPAVRLPATCVR